jgi:YfiH family protein
VNRNILIFPDIFDKSVKAFFTGKNPGIDFDIISQIALIDKKKIYMPIQKHTDNVLCIDSKTSPKIADAVITNRKGILIGVRTADCVPILLYDKKNKVCGAVHAGWRGTAAAILKKTINTMRSSFNSSSQNILLAVGPSIKMCCYNVGHDVLESIINATGEYEYFMKQGEKCFLDLALANKHQAIASGIREENIWLSDECTCCLYDKFYSYRYESKNTDSELISERQGGFIGIPE